MGAPIDVHLMVSPVDKIIGEFAEAGASFITFHPEATGHIDRSLQLVRAAGCKSGLVFNPATLDKAKEARKMIDESGYDISLQIDGGVGPANIAEVAAAGVDMFVAGSAIFNTDDYKETIDTMRSELDKVPVPGKEFAFY